MPVVATRKGKSSKSGWGKQVSKPVMSSFGRVDCRIQQKKWVFFAGWGTDSSETDRSFGIDRRVSSRWGEGGPMLSPKGPESNRKSY